MNSNLVVTEKRIFHSLELRVDMFDAYILSIQYDENASSLDVFKIQPLGWSLNRLQYYHLRPVKGWVRINVLPVHEEDILVALKDSPCNKLGDESSLDELIQFVRWLGVGVTFESTLFFARSKFWRRYDYPKSTLYVWWHYRAQLTEADYGEPITNKRIKKLMANGEHTKRKYINLLPINTQSYQELEKYIVLILRDRTIFCDDKFIRVNSDISAEHFLRYCRILYTNPLTRQCLWLFTAINTQGIEVVERYHCPRIQLFTKLYIFCRDKGWGGEAYNEIEDEMRSIKTVDCFNQNYNYHFDVFEERMGISWHAFHTEDFEFPRSPCINNDYFSRIETLESLRRTALEFDNCVFNYADSAINGHMLFFSYFEPVSMERGLLSLYLDEERGQSYGLGEFQRESHIAISNEGHKNLLQWINSQRVMIRLTSTLC